jgi:hypothetical protein
MNYEYAVERIFEILDESDTMGAALDCLSEKGKAKLFKRLEQLLKDLDDKN